MLISDVIKGLVHHFLTVRMNTETGFARWDLLIQALKISIQKVGGQNAQEYLKSLAEDDKSLKFPN